jgi:hypothetical protein
MVEIRQRGYCLIREAVCELAVRLEALKVG